MSIAPSAESTAPTKPAFSLGFLDRLYQRLMSYADHPLAVFILALLAFCSSIFFPFPPDFLFGIVALQNRRRIPLLVLMTAFAAATGGLVMYGIGYGLYEAVGLRILNAYGWHSAFQSVQSQLHQWGFLALMVKAFTPIPYKLVALAYGVGHFDLQSFFVASFLGRGARYCLEGVLVWFLGPSLQQLLEKYLKFFVFAFFFLVFAGFFSLKFL